MLTPIQTVDPATGEIVGGGVGARTVRSISTFLLFAHFTDSITII